jgi:hypothetical protein
LSSPLLLAFASFLLEAWEGEGGGEGKRLEGGEEERVCWHVCQPTIVAAARMRMRWSFLPKRLPKERINGRALLRCTCIL